LMYGEKNSAVIGWKIRMARKFILGPHKNAGFPPNHSAVFHPALWTLHPAPCTLPAGRARDAGELLPEQGRGPGGGGHARPWQYPPLHAVPGRVTWRQCLESSASSVMARLLQDMYTCSRRSRSRLVGVRERSILPSSIGDVWATKSPVRHKLYRVCC